MTDQRFLTDRLPFPVPLRGMKLALVSFLGIVFCTLLALHNNSAEFIDAPMELPVGEKHSVFMGPHAVYILEDDEPLTLEDVRQREDWQPLRQKFISLGSITKPAWIKATLRNTSSQMIPVRFDTRRVAFKFLAIHIERAGSGSPETILDYRYEDPFSDRPVQHRILVADTELAPGEEAVAYIRYRGIYNSVLPIRAASPAAFEKADKHEMFWSAQFYGTFSTMMFLTVLTGPLIGLRLGLSFAAFLVTGLLTLLSVEGYIDQFVVPVKKTHSPSRNRLHLLT